MSTEFLVLLFALVVEDQNLRATPLLYDKSNTTRLPPASPDTAKTLIKLDFAVGAMALIFQSNHVTRAPPGIAYLPHL